MPLPVLVPELQLRSRLLFHLSHPLLPVGPKLRQRIPLW